MGDKGSPDGHPEASSAPRSGPKGYHVIVDFYLFISPLMIEACSRMPPESLSLKSINRCANWSSTMSLTHVSTSGLWVKGGHSIPIKDGFLAAQFPIFDQMDGLAIILRAESKEGTEEEHEL